MTMGAEDYNRLQRNRERRARFKNSWHVVAFGALTIYAIDQRTNIINHAFSMTTGKPVNATHATTQLTNEVIHAGGQFFTSTLQKFDF